MVGSARVLCDKNEAYLMTVGCRESESDNSWKWLQEYRSVTGGPCFRSGDARCEEHEALKYDDQTFDITRTLKSHQVLTLDLISVSAMACAIPTPSSGEVPLPTSSISTKDLGVARPTRECRSIVEVKI